MRDNDSAGRSSLSEGGLSRRAGAITFRFVVRLGFVPISPRRCSFQMSLRSPRISNDIACSFAVTARRFAGCLVAMGLCVIGTGIAASAGCRYSDRKLNVVESAGPRERHPGLHNVVAMSGFLLNGSEPNGEAGFDSLANLGVKSIISVDGNPPDTARAAARGMKYVHLPLGYDGISEPERFRLTRAVRDLPKPIYIHCFHGFHRGPAAGTIALVSLGTITPEEGLGLMSRAGTDPNYDGLYDAVRRAKRLPRSVVSHVSGDFPDRVVPRGFTGKMATIGRRWDHLKLIAAAGFKTPPDHPDLVPEREAAALVSTLESVADEPYEVPDPAAFRQSLKDATTAARALSDEIVRGGPNQSKLLDLLRSTCKDCHARWRN